MKKIVTMLGVLSCTAYADFVPCNVLLINGDDSGYIKIYNVNDRSYEPMKIVENVIYDRCRERVKVDNMSCARFKPYDSTATICYIETVFGYFYVSRDYMETVNIVFSRWD